MFIRAAQVGSPGPSALFSPTPGTSSESDFDIQLTADWEVVNRSIPILPSVTMVLRQPSNWFKLVAIRNEIPYIWNRQKTHIMRDNGSVSWAAFSESLNESMALLASKEHAYPLSPLSFNPIQIDDSVDLNAVLQSLLAAVESATTATEIDTALQDELGLRSIRLFAVSSTTAEIDVEFGAMTTVSFRDSITTHQLDTSRLSFALISTTRMLLTVKTGTGRNERMRIS